MSREGSGSYPVPNSTETLVLGILSIVFCWCYGVVSIILAIIALVLASAGEKHYRLNPGLYSLTSYRNLRTGKTCAIVGLCLAALALILVILYIVIFGAYFFNMAKLGME
jgi:hypothetical protein